MKIKNQHATSTECRHQKLHKSRCKLKGAHKHNSTVDYCCAWKTENKQGNKWLESLVAPCSRCFSNIRWTKKTMSSSNFCHYKQSINEDAQLNLKIITFSVSREKESSLILNKGIRSGSKSYLLLNKIEPGKKYEKKEPFLA